MEFGGSDIVLNTPPDAPPESSGLVIQSINIKAHGRYGISRSSSNPYFLCRLALSLWHLS